MMAEVNHPIPPGRGSFKHTAAQLHSELQIKELISDSRLVKPGDTFVAYQGDKLDGREYIADALERGAQSIIWDPKGFVWPDKWQHIAHRPVAHLKENISELASVIYNSPSQHMSVIGVTGTNGKSTCSQWLTQLLTKKEGSCGLMGTLGNGIWPELAESLNTTLDAIECQKWLNHFVQAQCKNCVMEVSSHGLVQGRVSGISFTGAIFTNLTRDHLDYHGTMEAYAEAKALLFQAKGLQWAVINIDDAFGQTLVERYRNTIPVVLGYSLKPSENEEILSASNIRLNLQGISFDLAYQGKITEVKAPILGRFNVANLLAVLGALNCLGMDIKEAITSLDALQFPKGRLEKLSSTNAPSVVIDYAHTPDALEQVLLTLREIVPQNGKLICVFGCGGNRDTGKRSLMGRVADRLADQIIITNDNPRHEDPLAIAMTIRQAIEQQADIILDRRQAIESALKHASSNDVILIAGKGHENYQEVQGSRYVFSDHDVVSAWYQRRGQ